jgi:type I restriction enzyme S subunit
MSHLEDLIAEYCPDGVEYKLLSTLASISTGTQLNLTQLTVDGKYPVMNGGISPSGYYDSYNTEKDTITISQGGASAGYVNYITTNFWAGAHCYVVKPINNEIENKYLYYYLKNSEQKIQDTKTGAGIPGLNKSKLERFIISIPPIIIQREIVRILDKMTYLEAELEAELEARILQYEHYRANLLEFNPDTPNPARTPHLTHLLQTLCPDGVEYKALNQISSTMYRGAGIKRDQLTDSGTPCVRYGEIYTKYNLFFDKCISFTDSNTITSKKYFSHGDILFAITGEKVEEISKSTAYLGNDTCLAGGDIVVMKHKENAKFLSYALSTQDAQKQKSLGKVKSKVVHSSVPEIGKIRVPVPPLPIQEEIVAILDRFESLVSDLKEGLPAEITARRKQYEYYRNQLLTFKPNPPL